MKPETSVKTPGLGPPQGFSLHETMPTCTPFISSGPPIKRAVWNNSPIQDALEITWITCNKNVAENFAINVYINFRTRTWTLRFRVTCAYITPVNGFLVQFGTIGRSEYLKIDLLKGFHERARRLYEYLNFRITINGTQKHRTHWIGSPST